MHRCLQTPEIIVNICECLCKLDRKYHDLLAFGLTSRQFISPTLDIIWRKKSRVLFKLIKLMPEDLWELRLDENVPHRYLCFRRPVVRSDWDRLLLYAPRIKKIDHVQFEHVKDVPQNYLISPWVFVALAESVPYTPLFPNLTHLNLHATESCLAFAYHFIGPQLQHARLVDTCKELEGTTDTENVSLSIPFLNGFPKSGCNLTTFSYHFPGAAEGVSNMLCSQHCLFNVSVGAINRNALHHLAGLPCLGYLDFRYDDTLPEETYRLFPTLLPTNPFPSLLSLSLQEPGLDLTLLLLDTIQTNSLYKLSVQVTKSCSTETWRAATERIGRSRFRAHLLYLNIREAGTRPDRLEARISQSVVEPLFSCENIEELELLPTTYVELDDMFIDRLARSLPNLTSLSLGPKVSQGWAEHEVESDLPLVSFHSITSLVRHCRHLSRVYLPVDARNINPNTWEPYVDIEFKRLSTLQLVVTSSPIDDPVGVGAVLSALCRTVQIVMTNRDVTEGEGFKNWGLLWNLVPAITQRFAVVRAQERNRAGIPDI